MPILDTRCSPAVLLLAALLAACSHTDPIGYANYGAIGPRSPGPEALLDGAGPGSAWTENGGGILYLGGCLGRERSSAPSIIMLPAIGGSATWEMCEADLSLKMVKFPLDSASEFDAAALGADGRLLYVECVYPNLTDISCGNLGHMSMWLSDSAWPFTRRRKLFELYHVVLGAPADSNNVLNDLSNLSWVGPAAFVARGLNMNPHYGVTFLGITYGTTAATSPSLSLIAGTSDVQLFSVAEAGAALVFARAALVVERMPVPGGAATTIVTLPAAPGRTIVDISCKSEMCLLLTHEGGAGVAAQSTFWTLDLRTAELATLRAYPSLFSSAQLSPSSNSVLVGEADGLHLFTDLLP
jgi:hypothetical protein